MRQLTTNITSDEKPLSRGQSRNHAIVSGIHITAANHSWKHFLRYKAETERTHTRAFDELMKLRSLRSQLPTNDELPLSTPPNRARSRAFRPSPIRSHRPRTSRSSRSPARPGTNAR